MKQVQFSRREAMVLGAGAATVTLLGGVTGALAATATDDAINAFTGGATPSEGKITLGAPEIAENGNTVPIDVSVESAMTDDDHVESVLVLADGNPNPGVATFHFTPMSGDATAATRIRLASTQNVVAVAKMKDGSVYMAKREVKVTIGGCGG
ncbi:MAG: thiosulfate oxidation carrier protein SoxY [Pseudomonadota bacterium]